jgi:hypothetical protein
MTWTLRRDVMVREFRGEIKLDVRESTPDWESLLNQKAPAGSPNVLVVLYDDTGCASGLRTGAGSTCRPCRDWPTTV